MIQQAINQGLSIASALYTQTGHYREKIAKREIALKNNEIARQIGNEEKISNKLFPKKMRENVIKYAENERPAILEAEENISNLKKQKAILTGETKDINAYVKHRRKLDASVLKNQDAQESLRKAQEEKRQKFYLGGEEIPENSPLYTKAMEAYKKQQGGNK